MTAEERAMVRAILIDPWDDALRLIYADWLEEHGREAHARYIRQAVENQVRKFWPGRRGVEPVFPTTRESILLIRPGEYGDTACDLCMSRGMAEGWQGLSGEFVMIAGRLFGEHPITNVVLTNKAAWQEGGLYWWQQRDMPDTYPPAAIARYLRHNPYESRKAANQALSDACVAWGRDQAGLPPLPTRPA